MKTILGLDLGTNSIGWALTRYDFDKKEGKIIGLGSRIIPMSKAVLNNFEKGVTKSQTAERTEKRGARRLYERSHTRRERLHRVLNVLNYLPKTYSKYIDFNKRRGQFIVDSEPLLPYSDQVDESGKRIFLFQSSYNEMEKEFRNAYPNLPKTNKKGKPYKLPFDWTLYYLRKKALTEKITNEELAWILLNFNQKRGYYQEREVKEVIEEDNKKVEYKILLTKTLKETVEKVADRVLYDIIFEDEEGNIYDDSKKRTTNPLFWENKKSEFIITTTIKKDNSLSRTYREVKSENDWEAIKQKTQQDLGSEFVGKYIYEAILKNPTQKIKGELIRTIDRDFYFEELEVILRTQLKFRNKDWTDEELYKKTIQELYPNNQEHQRNLLRQKDKFIHLFLRDILFYHRPLKSQKSLISQCSFETRYYTDKESGEIKKVPVIGMPKSHPLFQEFRIWQLAHNIRIKKRELRVDGRIKLNIDVTHEFIKSKEDFSNFFEFLYNKNSLTQKQLIAYFINDKKEQALYCWNYADDDKLKLDCNQTRPALISKFSKEDKLLYSDEIEYKLWYIIYSVTDKKEYLKAIERFSKNHHLSEATLKKLYILIYN